MPGKCLTFLVTHFLSLQIAACYTHLVRPCRLHSIYKYPTRTLSSSTNDETPQSSYVPIRESSSNTSEKPLYPKVGDVVRYYDLDGGRQDGEVLVGKISFLQKRSTDWLVELTELENVGDGYYAEYSSRKRQFKKTSRPLEEIAPIAASFVRAEGAYKVPRKVGSDEILVMRDQYTIEGFVGPFGEVNEETLQSDLELYSKLKFDLLRNAALAGVVGTLLADLAKGTQDAIIYGAGALAGVGYLFFLSLKTDTIASANTKLGANVSNIRFVLPLIVLLGVTIYNLTHGMDASNVFSTVTPEQFAAAMLGFLTYRIPLFISQLSPLLAESGSSLLPGSAGVAMQLATAETKELVPETVKEELTPILLVSGPPGTGKTSLVEKLIAESNGRLVAPEYMDRISDGVTFERLESRDEFLVSSDRSGLTRAGILNAAKNAVASNDDLREAAVVVDADVELAKKIVQIGGARVIGVWVGLDSMEKFESHLRDEIQSGKMVVPEDETEESVIRAKTKEIVADIEYGVVSGVFEFTILNDDIEESLKELQFAAEYCFK